MEKEIEAFISYLHNVKKKSENTCMSYKRDLYKLEFSGRKWSHTGQGYFCDQSQFLCALSGEKPFRTLHDLQKYCCREGLLPFPAQGAYGGRGCVREPEGS